MTTSKPQAQTKPQLYYWIRELTEESVGMWEIIKVSDSNIHIINDPESFGCEVIPVPRSPRDINTLQSQAHAEELEQVAKEVRIIRDGIKENTQTLMAYIHYLPEEQKALILKALTEKSEGEVALKDTEQEKHE